MPHAYIDAHCHLADLRLQSRIDEVIRLARSQGIVGFIQGGVNPEDWDRQLEIQAKYPGAIFPCFGLHPWYVAGLFGMVERSKLERDLERLPRYLEKSVGLGELGLDFGKKIDPATEALQTEIFRAQLGIAQAHRKPLVLHIVRAHSQALKLLSEMGPWPMGGIVHAFSGSLEIARSYIDLGLTLSIGAAALNPGHDTFKRGLKKIPLERIVVESDSPDQIPLQFKGIEEGVNDPRSLLMVAEAICELQDLGSASARELLNSSSLRLKRLFGLELLGSAS